MYWCVNRSTACLSITSKNTSVVGDGMDATYLIYDSSATTNSGGIGPGSGIVVNGTVNNPIDGSSYISNFTIEDINTASGLTLGHNPSAIEVTNICSATMDRIHTINSKGNGSVNYNTNVNCLNDKPGLLFTNNIIEGNSAGNWGEGDGLNWNTPNARIIGNYIYGQLRHSLEAGAQAMLNQQILGNTLDGFGRGFDGISGGEFSDSTISGNTIKGIGPNHTAIELTADASAPSSVISNVTIENNVLISTAGGATGILVQPQAGSTVYALIFNDNEIVSATPILMYAQLDDTLISGNLFNLQGGLGPAVNGGAQATIKPACTLTITNNVISSGTAPSKMVDLGSDVGWNNNRLRLLNNVLGYTEFSARTGAIDGHAADPVTIPTIQPGSASADRLVTLTGAQVTDEVISGLDAFGASIPPLEDGLTFETYVSTQNTILWHLFNSSTSAISPAAHVYTFSVNRFSSGGTMGRRGPGNVFQGLISSTFTMTGTTMTVNGVKMIWPSSGTIGNYLQYTSTNTLQWVPAASSGGGYRIEPATVTINAAVGVILSSGIKVSNTEIITTTTTLTSTMSVVMVSAPANSAWVTLTLPDATANAGSSIMIYKVDATTGSVLINAAGGDLIQSTGTIRLDAKGQHASLYSLGSNGWGAGLGGIQTTPAFLGYLDGRDTNSVGASSTTQVCPITIDVPVTLTGYRYYQTAGAANIVLGLYDQYGKLVTSTGPVSDGGFGAHTIATTPVNIAPGQYYYALQASNVVANYGGVSANGSNGSLLCSSKSGTTMGLPSPFGFPGTGTGREFTIKLLVNGGRQLE